MIIRSDHPAPRAVCLLLVLAIGSAGLGSQAIVDQLAREICNCLEAAPLIYPRVQADRCVENVLEAHPRQIRSELQLSVRNAEDRQQLEDLLLDPLTSDCAVLRELPQTQPPAPPRYSDLQLMQSPDRVAEKDPAADTSERVIREASRQRTVVGRLVEASAVEWTVVTPDSTRITLQVPPDFPGTPPASREAYYRFAYELDWHGAPRRVLRKLEGVKSLN